MNEHFKNNENKITLYLIIFREDLDSNLKTRKAGDFQINLRITYKYCVLECTSTTTGNLLSNIFSYLVAILFWGSICFCCYKCCPCCKRKKKSKSNIKKKQEYVSPTTRANNFGYPEK